MNLCLKQFKILIRSNKISTRVTFNKTENKYNRNYKTKKNYFLHVESDLVLFS
jgi:translation initiation factor RLI1